MKYCLACGSKRKGARCFWCGSYHNACLALLKAEIDPPKILDMVNKGEYFWGIDSEVAKAAIEVMKEEDGESN